MLLVGELVGLKVGELVAGLPFSSVGGEVGGTGAGVGTKNVGTLLGARENPSEMVGGEGALVVDGEGTLVADGEDVFVGFLVGVKVTTVAPLGLIVSYSYSFT